MTRLLVVLMIALSCSAPSSAISQPIRSVAMDFSVGSGRGLGGRDYPERGMFTGAVMLSAAVRLLPHGALTVAAITAGEALHGDLVCIAIGGCRTFPSFFSVGVLAGWAQRVDQSSGVRILAGPAIVVDSDTDKGGFGAIARADAAAPLIRHVSLIVIAQGTFAKRVEGARVGARSFGLGLRIH